MSTILLSLAIATTTSTITEEAFSPDTFVLESPFSDEDVVKINIYGYADFSYTKTIADRRSLIGDYVESDSFAVGSFNLYLRTDLSESWRTLAEVRFLYAPNGAHVVSGQEIQLINTEVLDPTRFAEQRWGGIDIQRAYLEYEAHPSVTLRVGQWLTPYGIWNVDHGSPTIVGVRTPFPVERSLLPQRQTGLMAFGRFDLDVLGIDYALTLSNGRGLFDSHRDLDGNKAVGGRLAIDNHSFGHLTIGSSFYYGLFTAAERVATVEMKAGETRPVIDTVPTEQFKELSIAGDIRWELGGLLVQLELMTSQHLYTEEGRNADPNGFPGLVADFATFGAYGLIGYRSDWCGMMPFVTIEHMAFGRAVLLDELSGGSIGVNLRPIPSVALKAQVSRYYFHIVTPIGQSNDALSLIETQAAWAF
jgi:hypothetical protein